jgi:flagellar hook-associated protein 1 FlgK
MSGFSTMNTAISGLLASQRALDITGQNVVNANTPGYSRQSVRISAVGGTPSSTFHTGNAQAVVGGVRVETIERIRDTFLENTRVAAGASLEAVKAQTNALQGAEQLLSEPGDGGLQSVIDDFYNAWHDLAQKPTDSGAGAVVVQRGKTVASQLAFVSSGVEERWDTARDELANTVDQLNQAAGDLAKINAKIREGNVVGRPVNELLDQRDTLVRTLGELAGGKPSVRTDDGMVSVTVNGLNLVTGDRAEQFTLSGGTTLATATTDPPTVTFGTSQVSVASGKAAGLLAALRTDLPNVSAQLDGVAVALRDAVNAVHNAGFTTAGIAGGDFFDGTGASNLTVIPTQTSELAVASQVGAVDGNNALNVADLSLDVNAENALGPGSTSPSGLWRNLTANVGTQVQGLQRGLDVQQTVLTTAESAVESDAGVNLDEEMSSLLMFQRSYQASARVITTIDNVLETLINLGR